jgi:1-acyl-sn-glycerol-3-phosphate acyltransferase
MRKFLGFLFAIWAITWFIITMIFALPFMWFTNRVKEPLRTKKFLYVSKWWMKVWFVLVGLRLKVTGQQYFEDGENYVVIYNHNSFLDVPLSCPFTPGANKTIAKKEMSKIPLFGYVYKRGSVLVDRKQADSRKNAYFQMKQVLDMGMHMCIYPEGTRNSSNRPLQEFKDGAFKLALETNKEIICCILKGTKSVLPPKASIYFWPGKVSMDFLAPISLKNKNVETLKQECFNLMENNLNS